MLRLYKCMEKKKLSSSRSTTCVIEHLLHLVTVKTLVLPLTISVRTHVPPLRTYIHRRANRAVAVTEQVEEC